MYDKYVYSDFHQMNLDWIIEQMRALVKAWDDFSGIVTAEAHEADAPEVSVEGNLKTGVNFDFGLVRGADGAPGPEGPQGVRGPQGPQGEGLQIDDVYATYADLVAAHPTGSAGDAYLVGSSGAYTMYIWSTSANDWAEAGALTSPSPSSAAPVMDGTASAGVSDRYSRGDHVHPSDSSKQDTLVSGVNIKTINGYSLLNEGNIEVQPELEDGVNIKTINSSSILGSGNIDLQTPLVSGTNIKTVNGDSMLGSGNISVQAPLVSGSTIKTINSESLMGSGNISVQPTLVSEVNIKTINGDSILGSGDLEISPRLPIDMIWYQNYLAVSTYGAQTVSIDQSIDLDQYHFFVVVFLITANTYTSASGSFTVSLITTLGGTRCSTGGTSNNNNFARGVEIDTVNKTITFSAGYYNGSSDNTRMIPCSVWGF